LSLLDLVAPTYSEFEPGYEDTWNLDEYKGILRHLVVSANGQTRDKMYVLVRTGRNISRVLTDTAHTQFADAPDTARTEGTVAKQFAQNVPVLMMLRQNGTEAQSWRGCPFWWPVILTPANTRTTLFAHNR